MTRSAQSFLMLALAGCSGTPPAAPPAVTTPRQLVSTPAPSRFRTSEEIRAEIEAEARRQQELGAAAATPAAEERGSVPGVQVVVPHYEPVPAPAAPTPDPNLVQVKAYTRKDGTKVEAYTRRKPTKRP